MKIKSYILMKLIIELIKVEIGIRCVIIIYRFAVCWNDWSGIGTSIRFIIHYYDAIQFNSPFKGLYEMICVLGCIQCEVLN